MTTNNSRSGLAVDLTATNRWLGEGETVKETDTGKVKIGPGSWNDLDYEATGSGGGVFDEAVMPFVGFTNSVTDVVVPGDGSVVQIPMEHLFALRPSDPPFIELSPDAPGNPGSFSLLRPCVFDIAWFTRWPSGGSGDRVVALWNTNSSRFNSDFKSVPGAFADSWGNQQGMWSNLVLTDTAVPCPISLWVGQTSGSDKTLAKGTTLSDGGVEVYVLVREFLD